MSSLFLWESRLTGYTVERYVPSYHAGMDDMGNGLTTFDIASARELRHKSGIPIMLDESVFSPMDAMNVIRQGAADMINVKLSKSGGIHQAIKVLTVAQAAGVDAMVGCMLESKLGIAASLVIANSVNNVKFTDLDGFTYLSEQPFEGGVELKLGMDYLVPGPGFAVKLKENQK